MPRPKKRQGRQDLCMSSGCYESASSNNNDKKNMVS